jgi:hypothetical protein
MFRGIIPSEDAKGYFRPWSLRPGVSMSKRVIPWIIFISFFSLLVFSASSLAQTVDWLLWPIRLGLIAGLSLLLLWSHWRHRNDGSTDKHAAKDSADHFLSSLRSWYYGAPKLPK